MFVKAKKMQEKNGAQSNWSASIFRTTALFEVGSFGIMFLSKKLYHT